MANRFQRTSSFDLLHVSYRSAALVAGVGGNDEGYDGRTRLTADDATFRIPTCRTDGRTKATAVGHLITVTAAKPTKDLMVAGLSIVMVVVLPLGSCMSLASKGGGGIDFPEPPCSGEKQPEPSHCSVFTPGALAPSGS